MSSPIIGTKEVPLDDVKAYPGNARRGDVSLVASSLAEHGQYKPIVVQAATGYVLAGNHTVEAARSLGWQSVLATFVDVDAERARRINLIDNRSNDVAGYDDQALADLLSDLAGDYTGTGFEAQDLTTLLDTLATGGQKSDGHTSMVPTDPVTEPGDVWVLGRHRLICGDASQLGTFHQLLQGEAVDLTVTSPPYNQNLDSFKASGMRVENPKWVERMAASYEDSKPEPVYQEEQRLILGHIAKVTAPDGACFYNHKVRYRDREVLHPLEWLTGLEDWRIRQEIVWDRYTSIALNARMFMPIDERIYWLTRGEKFRFANTTAVKSRSTIWRINPHAEVQVSAPFPVELPSWCIEACSLRDDVVLDPYGGSGTTLIACEVLGRRGRMIEVHPGYCDVIVERWESVSGQKAVRAEDGDEYATTEAMVHEGP